jgi:diaminopimelate decarboxylase
MTGAASQFGLPLDTARSVPWLFEPAGNLRPIGIHFFPVTNVAEVEALIAEFRLSISTAAQLIAETGLRARLVDIGGGFGAPFATPGNRPKYEGLREALVQALDEFLPGWRENEPLIAFESGRYAVGDCGTLLTRVLDVKKSAGTTFVVLDAGTNVLGGMSGLGRMLAPGARPAQGAITDTRNGVNLVGPLCTPLDVLSRAATIGIPRIGDVLEIPNVGAYGLSASLVSFLSRPLPAEVVIDRDGEVVSARRLEIHGRLLGGLHAPDLGS